MDKTDDKPQKLVSSSGYPIDHNKLKHVKQIHAQILQQKRQEEKLENQRLIKTTLYNGGTKTEFNIPFKNAAPIRAPQFAKPLKVARKRAVGEVMLEVPCIHLHTIERRPDRPHFTPSQTNLEVEDDPVLHYVPYFDDSDVDDEFHSSLLEVYDNKCHEARDTSLCLDVIVQLVRSLKKGSITGSDAGSSTAYEPKHRNSKSNKRNMTSFTDDEIFEYISMLYDGKDTKLKPKEIKELYENHISPKILRQTMRNIDEPLDKFYTVDLALDTYMKLYCPMCQIYDCLLHQGYDVQKPTINNMPLSDETSPCGSDCFLNLDTVNIHDYLPSFGKQDNESAGSKQKKYPKIYEKSLKKKLQLSENERTLLAVYIDTYKDNYCVICSLMNAELPIACYEIYIKAQEIKKMLGEKAVAQEKLKKDINKKPKHKPRKKTSVWKNFSANKSDLRKSYVPCNHPGESCKSAKNCSCAANGTCCEKYCMCADECQLRFPGCNCKSSCQTARCACNLANRECDGDRCKCSADSFQSHDLKCKNCSIQRGLGKHLLLGVSQVAGWGVYLNGTAEKNDLISEYCGELISHHDAEARGIVYDKTGVSFLFDLNKDLKTCDAKNIGNKIRFANHDRDDPNCYPRIMSVNGSQRIGIYAKRRIREQEELFFDYGTVKFNPADRAVPRE